MNLWYAFISQTGTELFELCRYVDKTPGAVVTNHIEKIHYQVRKWLDNADVPIHTISYRPRVEDYRYLNIPANALITLHGYLRIIPDELCKKHNIYNGHPGLISSFPELKGYNPQEKAFKLGHTLVGSVVHKVIPEVDEGEIITSATINITRTSETTVDDYYKALRETSLQAWFKFFNKRPWESTCHPPYEIL